MRSKTNDYAGIGALLGAACGIFGAIQKYDFANNDQMQRAVGYVIGWLFMGAVLGASIGYFSGKSK